MKRAILSKMSLLLAVCSLAVLSLPLRADVSGFGGTGAGWTTNAFAGHPAPPIAADVLTITTAGDTSDSRSAWHNTKQRIDGAWTATFTYTKTARGLDNPGLVYWDADGLTFAFQNAGLNALGQAGGNIGYTNIVPSAGLAIKVYVSNNAGAIDDESGLGNVSGGQDISPVTFQNRGTIDFDALNQPITFTLSYDPQTGLLAVQAVQGNKSSSFSSTIDLPAALGSNFAYLGFTGGTGAASMTATVGGFSFQENLGGAAQPGTFAGLIRDGATDANENTGFSRAQLSGCARVVFRKIKRPDTQQTRLRIGAAIGDVARCPYHGLGIVLAVEIQLGQNFHDLQLIGSRQAPGRDDSLERLGGGRHVARTGCGESARVVEDEILERRPVGDVVRLAQLGHRFRVFLRGRQLLCRKHDRPDFGPNRLGRASLLLWRGN